MSELIRRTLKEVPVAEAKERLTELLRRAVEGEEIILTREGQPAVRLVPVRRKLTREQQHAIPEAVRASGRGLLTRLQGRRRLVARTSSTTRMAFPRDSGRYVRSPGNCVGEELAHACMAVLESEDLVLISAGTVVEALVVSTLRNVTAGMRRLIDDLGFSVVSVTPEAAKRAADAYARWGKGIHPARLNFGDCFAYEVAKRFSCPLLFIGQDFAQTDIESALKSP